MQNIKTQFFAAFGALLMTSILAAPIASGEASAQAMPFTLNAPMALA